MAELDGHLWIEHIETPKLQRLGDESIMERFVQIHKVTRRHLERANAVRLYLWVVTIADLAHTLGSFIPDNTLTGEWQAGSDFEWPHQVRRRDIAEVCRRPSLAFGRGQ